MGETEHIKESGCVLSKEYTKIVIFDEKRQKEIAVITNDLITTAEDTIVVRLTPAYD